MPTGTGATVPLKAVADITFGQGPTRVRRYNQSRRVALEADLNGVELGAAMKKINALPTAKNLPHGREHRRPRQRGGAWTSCSPASPSPWARAC